MFRFLGKVFRLFFTVAMVLLLGQIHIGEKTIAGRFHDAMFGVWNRQTQKIFSDKALAGLVDNKPLSGWFRQKKLEVSQALKPLKSKPESTAGDESDEDYSRADQELLIRLLQK